MDSNIDANRNGDESIYIIGLSAMLGRPVVMRQLTLTARAREAFGIDGRPPSKAVVDHGAGPQPARHAGCAFLMDGVAVELLTSAVEFGLSGKVIDHRGVVFPAIVDDGWVVTVPEKEVDLGVRKGSSKGQALLDVVGAKKHPSFTPGGVDLTSFKSPGAGAGLVATGGGPDYEGEGKDATKKMTTFTVGLKDGKWGVVVGHYGAKGHFPFGGSGGSGGLDRDLALGEAFLRDFGHKVNVDTWPSTNAMLTDPQVTELFETWSSIKEQADEAVERMEKSVRELTGGDPPAEDAEPPPASGNDDPPPSESGSPPPSDDEDADTKKPSENDDAERDHPDRPGYDTSAMSPKEREAFAKWILNNRPSVAYPIEGTADVDETWFLAFFSSGLLGHLLSLDQQNDPLIYPDKDRTDTSGAVLQIELLTRLDLLTIPPRDLTAVLADMGNVRVGTSYGRRDLASGAAVMLTAPGGGAVAQCAQALLPRLGA